jgi:hypothetical protein
MSMFDEHFYILIILLTYMYFYLMWLFVMCVSQMHFTRFVFFWKGLAIEVGDLGDATVFTVLPVALSHVNMDDNDIRITWQYGFSLIMHHYIS